MSDFDPADVPAAGGSDFSDPISSRLTDLDGGGAPGGEPPDREGLPARYRMRADPHYVEQLLDDEHAGQETAPPPSRPSFGESRVRPPRERQERVLVQFARELTEIESATGLLERATSDLSRRVGLDLIRARTWRARWLLRANALLEGTHRGRRRRQPVGPVLEAVAKGLAAECRLAGVRLELGGASSAEVEVDAEALAAATAGGVVWTLGVLDDPDGVVIRLEAAAADDGTVRLEVVLPDAGRGVVTGPADGWMAGLAASVARKVAAMHGGEAVFMVADGYRTFVRLTVAASA